LAAEDMAQLEAYAAGVNEYIRTTTLLPPEFIALGIN
jgi:acyl-homoserine lactone acylase PvdQ